MLFHKALILITLITAQITRPDSRRWSRDVEEESASYFYGLSSLEATGDEELQSSPVYSHQERKSTIEVVPVEDNNLSLNFKGNFF